ncbi:hypothetical protein BKA93DRAFT_744857, partial [Sparassis latifolia]
DNKLSFHAESSIKHHKPSILKLAKTYNNLCKQMDLLIKQRKAPQYAVSLQPIQDNGLFKLDVNDDIWQDVSLDDNDDITWSHVGSVMRLFMKASRIASY